MNNIPCKNCITLAICKGRASKNRAVINLCNKCSILYEYTGPRSKNNIPWSYKWREVLGFLTDDISLLMESKRMKLKHEKTMQKLRDIGYM